MMTYDVGFVRFRAVHLLSRQYFFLILKKVLDSLQKRNIEDAVSK
jgi:hypothetical protein